MLICHRSRLLNIFLINHLHTNFNSKRTDHFKADFFNPETIPLEKWKKIMWVARDMKAIVEKKNRHHLNLLEDKYITLLFLKPHGRFQLAFSLAANLLGAKTFLYCDPNFENQCHVSDSARALSNLTDMIVVHGFHHDVLVKLKSDTKLPIFPASCDLYSFQKALSDLMTFFESFKRLKGLKLAWIGPPNAVFNTYLLIYPLFGIKIQYVCICKYGSGIMTPINKFRIRKNLLDENAVREFPTAEEAITGANIIAIGMHPDVKFKINLETLQKADKNWTFIHSLPRGKMEVAKEVFEHEKNLSWLSSDNQLFIAMAVILLHLKEYEPLSEIPNFENSI